jgi:hypothetical protein
MITKRLPIPDPTQNFDYPFPHQNELVSLFRSQNEAV